VLEALHRRLGAGAEVAVAVGQGAEAQVGEPALEVGDGLAARPEGEREGLGGRYR